MIEKPVLVKRYLEEGKSARRIARELDCSENKVTYWLQRHNISKRSIADAVYLHNNPNGHPFKIRTLSSNQEWFLYGLGLGLFWGEGNKVNKHSVRLGNTDVDLIKNFLQFLYKIFNIDRKRLRFGLQLFTDIPKEQALRFWCSKLKIRKNQFQKVVVTRSVKKGTYRKKSQYGVLTVYFSNTKLRDTIVSAIDELREDKPS